ncbi:hypothetical protein GCM10027614_12950 [Micromonospora vulcania]
MTNVRGFGADADRFGADADRFTAHADGFTADADGFTARRNGFGTDRAGFTVDRGPGGRPGSASPSGAGSGQHPADDWSRSAGPPHTASGTGDRAPDSARLAASGPWPALPDDQPGAGIGGGRAGHGAYRAGPVTGGLGAQSGDWSAAFRGLWPELPDDRSLWTVPGAALDATQVSRLDREQAGD